MKQNKIKELINKVKGNKAVMFVTKVVTGIVIVLMVLLGGKKAIEVMNKKSGTPLPEVFEPGDEYEEIVKKLNEENY